MFIGEIGINHDGDLNKALEMIKESKRVGVDVVKFQKRNVDKCFSEEEKEQIKDSIFGKMKYIEYKRLLEFGKEEYDIIDAYCKEIGIQWTASVWDLDSLEFLMQYDVPFVKIPSARMTDIPLLNAVNMCGLPVMLSIGGTTSRQIQIALFHLVDTGHITILQCNSTYPSAINELDLDYIPELKKRFLYDTIGYSGHEQGYLPTLVAKALGAEVIERHITLDKNSKGSDHKASLDMKELEQLIKDLKAVDIIKGTKEKIVYDSEVAVMNKLRHTV